MKQLDKFSRFEKSVYWLGVLFAFIGAPFLVGFLVDHYLLKDLHPLVRYPLLFVSWILVFALSISIMAQVEFGFNRLREFLGMKRLYDLEREIKEERESAEQSKEDRRQQWFAGLSEKEQRYSIWERQQRQIERLDEIISSLERVKLWVFSILALIAGIWLSR